LWYRMES